MDLHPYDGVTRRFRHDGIGDRAEALAIIERVLGVTPASGVRVLYDLSFDSGSMGVFDHLAISIEADREHVDAVVRDRGFIASTDALADPEVRWLLGDAEDRVEQPSLASYVDEHRAPFQPALSHDAAVWFGPQSGVNHWELLYAQEGWLHFLAFDQG